MEPSVTKLRWTALAALGALAACDETTPTPPPPQCLTNFGQNVTLAVGAYAAIVPLSDHGCLIFPGNASVIDSVEYLVVPQIATDSQGRTASFILEGDTLHPALATQVGGRASGGGLSPALRFHDFLRGQERANWAGLPPAPRAAAVDRAAASSPPVVGAVQTFRVCATVTCSSFATVTATAKTVTGHLAIFVDNTAPAPGLTQADFDELGALFDSRLYAIDTTAFGRESDINGDSVVVVLMTNVVNKLVTKQQCRDEGFVVGFFFGFDLSPTAASDPRSNRQEMFYSMVADPDSTLSCAHSVTQVKRLAQITFVHEFQHMISYNQHVLLRPGQPQVTWLDEGMSHFAEELGGRSFLPGDPATFSDYAIGNLFNAYEYLDSSGTHFLAFSSGIGSLAERGAAWLFIRYVTDQFRADTSFAATAAFTRTLVQNTLMGGANVAAATGTSFATLAGRWALANYVSDLPGFTSPAELRYTSWAFRTTYASLNAQRPSVFPKPFPLTPIASTGRDVSFSGALRAGSGYYARVLQGPSAPGFTLLFSGPGGFEIPSNAVPRLNVIRIR